MRPAAAAVRRARRMASSPVDAGRRAGNFSGTPAPEAAVSAVRRCHCTRAALALALAAAACRDSTTPGADRGPRPTVDVAVAVSEIHGPSLSTDPDGTVRIQCTVSLQAVATGSGSAIWEDATFRWYAGKDRSVALDSEVVAASKIHSSWGRPEI